MSAVIDILKQVGALLVDDHFVLTSGKHSDTYINKDALYLHTRETSKIGFMLAHIVYNAGVEVDVVVGPALGGIILSQWTAFHLSELTGKETLSVYTEKDADRNQIFTRNYDQIVQNKKVLVVEDVVTTAGSIRHVVHSAILARGQVVGAGAMINRKPDLKDEDVGTHFFALETMSVMAWEQDEMPQWLKERPINTSVGHGKKYLQPKSSQ